MFQELSKSVKANLYERVSSPLIGSVAISWVAFNWKAIFYMLLSDAKIEDKIEYFSANYSDIDANIIYPVVVGGTISIVYPLAAFVPFWIWERVQHIQKQLKQTLSMNQLLSVEQSMQLRNELVQKDKKIREIIAENQESQTELNKTIGELTQENRNLYYKLSELSPLDPKADPSKISLPDVQYRILNEHTGLKDGHVQIASDIGKALMLPDAEIERALQELESQGFLKNEGYVNDDSGNNVLGYSLNELGRKYLGYKKSQLAA
ncbi:hypothetical protein M2G36_20605 [Vibrio vulnificus]|uniref:hypothetical protein n=1 Tax=Vibrio vulnificus TaxID=672 RepID=UPI001028F9D8|nr:hypothetical protein [Vibrio vulnificus]EHV9838532.1 hypothetical protein [Vibrio vulnificus]EID4377811.1 hypothetical protein [Vibrio vulnificus]MCU8562170.1 hypothetical protein [Vibrio vulnificus]RZR33972.1 hypothetical protein D8T59_21740 [Vibrio vulnificus]